MSTFNQLQSMLLAVAHALGPELREQVVFVGGCTTGLLITDEASKESIRYTDDVDLIVNVIGYVGWNAFSQRLQAQGFRVSMEDNVNCRMRLGGLKVDFMPDDETVLGFSNRWYKEAFTSAADFALSDGTPIKLITPACFVATKLEAWQGRGNNDPLSSHDLEDILNLFDGRPALVQELTQAPAGLQQYLAEQIARLLKHSDFPSAVQSMAGGDLDRQALIFQRLEAVAAMT